MSKLAYIRARLADLRRRRQAVRWGIGLAALLLAVLVALVAAFAIDWLFDMTRLQRLLTIVLGAAGLYWAYRRFALPWLQIKESEIDMALLVERQQKIDGDLVAALQFEGPEADRWGSRQLRHAVIDYVADFGKGLNVLEGFSVRRLARRCAVLVVALLAVGLFSVAQPDYVRAFVNRICLGSARYPTRTVLDQVAVNGKPIDFASGKPVRSPYGTLVNLSILASGELPEAGKVLVQPLDGRNVSTVKLTRDGDAPRFTAQLPEIVDALQVEVFLGDARTDPIRIEVIPLPVIETQAVVTVPEYAQYAAGPSGPQNARQLTVVEGSRVDLNVLCGNKRLTEVMLTIDGVPDPQGGWTVAHYPLKQVPPVANAPGSPSAPGSAWTLADTASPLSAVARPLRYAVQVTDEDGLKLPQPFQGSIRIKPDQRPQIAGGALTRFVLPSARPPVYYRATDDYGIAKLLAHLDVMRKDGEGQSEKRRTVAMQALARPLLREQLPFKGTYALDLAPLRLMKGDRLIVTLEAVDYRGAAEGQSGQSDPVVFEITDEAGILEDIAKPDYQSAEELDAIIRQQLNIGGAK
jgi:hypothetical protein